MLMDNFGGVETPHTVIVDLNGIIVFSGNLSTLTSLESIINYLLNNN